MHSFINILIAEDHILLAKLLTTNLSDERNFHVVDMATDGEQTFDILEKKDVDVLLLDINMPKIDGMTALKEIKIKYPNLKVIMLTYLSDGATIKQAVQYGANGYISKSSESIDIIKAIHAVLNGETYFCSICFRNLLQTVSGKPNKNNILSDNLKNSFSNAKLYPDQKKKDNTPNQFIDLYNNLTLREKEIIKLIAQGYTTKKIADELFISSRTVETHRKHILHKFGVCKSISLIKLYIDNKHYIED